MRCDAGVTALFDLRVGRGSVSARFAVRLAELDGVLDGRTVVGLLAFLVGPSAATAGISSQVTGANNNEAARATSFFWRFTANPFHDRGQGWLAIPGGEFLAG